MFRQPDTNVYLLERAVEKLGRKITDDLVFVGGCITGILITDPAAPPVRPTIDVDVVVEALTYREYHLACNRLLAKGFVFDRSYGAPACRMVSEDLTVDLMPSEPDVLGFGNVWYEGSVSNSERFILPSGEAIFTLTAPYFLATKLEAFKGRGKGDYLGSHDIEDIVAVLDGRNEITSDVESADLTTRNYLSTEFSTLLDDGNFLAALAGHLCGEHGGIVRRSVVLNRIREIAKHSNKQ